MAGPTPNATCNCGRPLACGAASGHCWCFDLPRTVPVPPAGVGGGCLCPKCLGDRIGVGGSGAAAQPVPREGRPLPPATG